MFYPKNEVMAFPNIGMRSWVGWDGTLCVPNVFIFVTEKEHNFQTEKNIALLHLKRKKKDLI